MNYDRLLQLGGIDREVPPLPGYITKDQLQTEIVDIADFKGYFTSVSDLEEVKGANKNDWAYVSGRDEHGNLLQYLYVYEEETGWGLNSTVKQDSFTPQQWAAINSGITESLAEAIPQKANVGTPQDNKDTNTVYGSKAYADYVVSLRRTETVYIAAGESDDDLEIEPTIISQLEETTVDLSMFDEYLYVLCPKSRGVVITMSSIDIPMTIIGEDAIEDVEYNIFQSDNTYTGELKIALLLKF